MTSTKICSCPFFPPCSDHTHSLLLLLLIIPITMTKVFLESLSYSSLANGPGKPNVPPVLSHELSLNCFYWHKQRLTGIMDQFLPMCACVFVKLHRNMFEFIVRDAGHHKVLSSRRRCESCRESRALPALWHHQVLDPLTKGKTPQPSYTYLVASPLFDFIFDVLHGLFPHTFLSGSPHYPWTPGKRGEKRNSMKRARKHNSEIWLQ